MTNSSPRIATINAVTASIDPARRAILEVLPDADVWTLLDDRLLQDAEAAGGLTPALAARMQRLITHAQTQGAEAILLTCSLYGPVAESFPDLGMPVVSADGPAFDAVAELRESTVAVVSGQPAPLADSVARTAARAAELGSQVTLRPVLAQDAVARADGDETRLASLIVDAIRSQVDSVDAVFLAQYSLSPAGPKVAELLSVPVLSGPTWAAKRVAAGLQRGMASA